MTGRGHEEGLWDVDDVLSFNQDGESMDFLGDTVDENLPGNTEDTDSIPSPGRFHMRWSN